MSAGFSLPGGLLDGEVLHREVQLREMTGELERRLADLSRAAGSPAARGSRISLISKMLCEAVSHVGSLELNERRASELCVADRQLLMLKLSACCFGDQAWLVNTCSRCEASFDLKLDRGLIPVKEAGPEFPYATVELRGVRLRFRAPRGVEQHVLALSSGEQAVSSLIRACFVSREDDRSESLPENLEPAELAAIESALEAVSPELGLSIQTQCPECGEGQSLGVDPYAWPGAASAHESGDHFLIEEVHCLASAYHWSELEILKLPTARRKGYLDLIERSTRRTREGGPTWVS